MPVIGAGQITISDNDFTGALTGSFSTASWGARIWFDGGGVDLDVTGNTFEYTRSGLNLDMSGDSEVEVSGNHFTSAGSGVVVGVDAVGLIVVDNDVTNVGDDFSFRNLADPRGVRRGAGDRRAQPGRQSQRLCGHPRRLRRRHAQRKLDADLYRRQQPAGPECRGRQPQRRGGNDIMFGGFGDDTLTAAPTTTISTAATAMTRSTAAPATIR